ncbi:MAG: PhzF family phenazine biosynthesis protein [Burkholderiales bacterium]|nr:PhzF family phenazine biosynthesis protein [Burkholderiales bacterium]
MQRRFKQVDVFTARAFRGNPVAVVLDCANLSPADMQRIARWANLSETTFVLPPEQGGDYRVRIFTPLSELPFAGHPAIGTVHAVLEAGMLAADRPQLVQECSAGLLPVRVEQAGPERHFFVRAPAASFRPIEDNELDELAAALDADAGPTVRPLVVSVGPTWAVLDLGNAEAVAAVQPNMSALAGVSRAMRITGVVVFGRDPGGDAPLRARAFAPAEGVPEDPVCGSGNVCVAAFLRETGLLAGVGNFYSVSQGREVGRDGRVHMRVDVASGAIELGGAAVTCIDGTLFG